MPELDERDVQPGNGETPTPKGDDLQKKLREANAESAERRHKIVELEAELNRVKETKLAEDQRWQELADKYQKERDELSPFKSQVETMSETLNKVLEAQLETLPDEAKAMIREMPGTNQEKLAWLANNHARLVRPAAPAMDAGARGDSAPMATMKLTAAQEQALVHAQRVDPTMTRQRYIARLLIQQQEEG